MPDSTSSSVSQLLSAVRNGDQEALNALFPLVYDELHTLAQHRRRQWQGDYTLNTTALVQEAYLKLVDQTHADWSSRAHFLAVASKAMRHILINYAEQRQAQKRGGDVQKLSLEEHRAVLETVADMSAAHAEKLVALHEALQHLEQVDERQARIVECRFFGGMTNEETAAVLGVSSATVKRGWKVARVWLFREVTGARS